MNEVEKKGLEEAKNFVRKVTELYMDTFVKNDNTNFSLHKICLQGCVKDKENGKLVILTDRPIEITMDARTVTITSGEVVKLAEFIKKEK